MIRAIISDIGRVILWFDNDIFIRKLAATATIPEDKIKEAAHWNLDLLTEFDKGALSPGDFYRRVVQAVGSGIGEAEFRVIYNDIFRLNPPALDVLRKQKAAGMTLILLSNTDILRFGHIRRTYPEILIFDDYVLSYELGMVKPEPRIYLEAARRARCRPEECVFIDDMPENVAAAAALGMSGIVYRPEIDLEAELVKLGLRS
jgi:HAD superfamily hydrolase (TIGR01509 family)